MEKVKIVVADDHPIVLMGIREILERDSRFDLVGEAHSSTELVQMYEKHQPDVVITDYNMPGDATYGDGVKLIELLLRRYPDTKILVLTMINNSPLLSSLYDLGVAGVLLKTGDLNEVIVAINTILRKRIYRGPAMQSATSVGVINDTRVRIASLSLKEYEVLRHFVVGALSVNDIARALNRSVKTVSAQKIACMRKLDVTNDQELLTFCIESKLFQ